MPGFTRALTVLAVAALASASCGSDDLSDSAPGTTPRRACHHRAGIDHDDPTTNNPSDHVAAHDNHVGIAARGRSSG
jgi:hypothetical protein